ncbi:Methylmalonyl-CoA carboxyltransferase [Phytophthora cinnamomi]|uniref:Methylmalonyl-CoA carboxyltransferase n=1 Tax=Phytophthora cinnamomi TaxID=4785 RepID=UPI003559E9DA|nr:Methylmalonyl-CoA carboxyltransferase [Phytophthora cinnamomi]
MKVDDTFLRMKTLAKMTRAALKIWQIVARYTAKPVLCQGVEGDMAMAKNSRREFADADTCSLSAKEGLEQRQHIAFEDKCKLITPEKAALYAAPPSRVQVVALANWESAPTFVLDDHLGEGFPEVSTDRLLNKCNPFLSGKRRALSDDITSEAPTVSTDSSTIPENDVEDQELSVVEEEEADVADDQEPTTACVPIGENVATDEDITECKSIVADLVTISVSADKAEPKKKKKRTVRWVCVGNGRYIKRGSGSTSVTESKVRLQPKAATSPTTRWVQVGHGSYKRIIVNGEAMASV